MAKGKLTRKQRGSRMQQPPVEWAFKDGRSIVVRSCGRWARMLPVARLVELHTAIDGMQQVVRALDSLDAVSDVARRHVLLCLCATQARMLMVEAAYQWDAVTDLAPWLRDAIARQGAMAAKSNEGEQHETPLCVPAVDSGRSGFLLR